MFRLFSLLVIFTTAAASSAAEVTIDTLLESSRTVAKAGSSRPCASFLQSSTTLNSASLFYGSVVCFYGKQETDSAFLLLLGQVRATTDMGVFEPVDDQAKQLAATLWNLIFYQFGGTGDNAIYQDPVRREALLKRVNEWRPEALKSYDPGWKATRQPSEEKYRKALEESKTHRRKQLEDYSRLISDTRYFEARKDLENIQRRNPNGIVTGTPDGKRSDELMKLMNAVEAEIKGRR